MVDEQPDMPEIMKRWAEVFGQPLPFGPEVPEEQIPVLLDCLEKCSEEPLDEYIDSLPHIVEVIERWVEVFGETPPWGFEVTEGQIPILLLCIEKRSQKPLKKYIASLPDDIVF